MRHVPSSARRPAPRGRPRRWAAAALLLCAAAAPVLRAAGVQPPGPSGGSSEPVVGTLAGTGIAGIHGDGGPALRAQLAAPTGIALGPGRSLLVVDESNRVRRIGADGIITTVAGTGVAAFSGDGGPALLAAFDHPTGIVRDAQGGLVVADQGNDRLRRIAPDGTVTTVAGTGSGGFSGDGPAIHAQLDRPGSVTVDGEGRIVFTDNANNMVRRIDRGGTLTTVAGNRVLTSGGDGGPATVAGLHNPSGVAVAADGAILIADQENCRIRRVAPDGVISTIAGTGACGFGGDGGPATAASLSFPSSVAVDADGGILIADRLNVRIRRIGEDGIITTIAGDGGAPPAVDGEPATQASFELPAVLVADPSGVLFLSDQRANRIRWIAPPEIAPKVPVTPRPQPLVVVGIDASLGSRSGTVRFGLSGPARVTIGLLRRGSTGTPLATRQGHRGVNTVVIPRPDDGHATPGSVVVILAEAGGRTATGTVRLPR